MYIMELSMKQREHQHILYVKHKPEEKTPQILINKFNNLKTK